MDNIQIKKLLIILMTSLICDLNFRLTFKNIDYHMDLGSYPTLTYDTIVILTKNVLCAILFLSLYFISKKVNSSEKEPDKYLKVTNERDKVVFKYVKEEKTFLGSLIIFHNLDTKTKQIIFCIKIFILILIIYLLEEIYYIIGNTHIMDRLNIPMRNLAVLITVFILSSLLIKKQFKLYRHQLFPSLIVIATSLTLIIFNVLDVTRFKKIFNINFFYYIIIYVLMGIELVLTKYLTYIQYINPFLILALKGVFGTMTFIIINIFINGEDFFYFIDIFMVFEYDYMYEEFNIIQKIIYIITFIIIQYLKIFIINEYSETHFLSVLMISDVFFYPLYYIEKFAIQKFHITTISTFYLNLIVGILNSILLLIFNEIIELKFCGFDKNLIKNIEKRKNLEMNKDNYINKEDDDSGNNSSFNEGSSMTD